MAVMSDCARATVIPGFMPALKALYERFASKAWADLCAPAVRWANEGHEVDSFEHLVMAQTVDYYLYTPSGRAHFMPGGHLPQVGDRWPKPELARTLARLADEGPDHFITGDWAQRFVALANQLGWPIEAAHMSAMPPRWGEGTRYRHGDFEIVQLSPPERQALFCALVLGILEHLDVRSLGHYTESAEALYYFGHALRRASFETGLINDPAIFEDPSETLLSPDYHAQLADLIRRSKPKVDLTEHVELVSPPAALEAAGAKPKQPTGSCELSIVDAAGTCVQMMNTAWRASTRPSAAGSRAAGGCARASATRSSSATAGRGGPWVPPATSTARCRRCSRTSSTTTWIRTPRRTPRACCRSRNWKTGFRAGRGASASATRSF